MKTIARLKTMYSHRDLLILLVTRDIKLKYRRSFLGYIWSVLNPLLLMLVYTAVFSNLFRRSIENFSAYLICGQVLFAFMTEATNGALNSITSNAALLKKVYVPKHIFTVAKVTSSLFNMLFALGALVIVFLFTGMRFTWYALLGLFPVLQLYVFCLGLGLFLAQLAVFFRDIQYIYSVITMAWMYLTPLFYDINILPDWLRVLVIRFNPMFIYIDQFRSFVYRGEMCWIPLIWRGCGFAAFMLLIGIWSFLRQKEKFILYI